MFSTWHGSPWRVKREFPLSDMKRLPCRPVSGGSACRRDLLPHFNRRLCAVGEIFVDGSDDLRAIAAGRRDALHRAGADIADSENAPAAGLHRQAVVIQVLTGEDEAAFVELEPGSGQPIGIGFGADEGEQVTDVAAVFGPGLAIPPGDGVKILVPSL